jgi:hypothetical protein
MKARLETHGGLTMGVRRVPVVVDSAALSSDAAAQLERLARAALAATPSPPPPGRGADGQSYVIILEGDGLSGVLRGSDTGESPQFQALREFLEGQAS